MQRANQLNIPAGSSGSSGGNQPPLSINPKAASHTRDLSLSANIRHEDDATPVSGFSTPPNTYPMVTIPFTEENRNKKNFEAEAPAKPRLWCCFFNRQKAQDNNSPVKASTSAIRPNTQ